MLTDDLLTRLREALGDDRVLTSDEDVDDRRHDYWVRSHLQSWRGTFEDRPGAVVRPRSTAEVQAVVRLAAETGTAVVPFGLGSGVCGGILPDRSMLLVDLSSMNRVRPVRSGPSSRRSTRRPTQRGSVVGRSSSLLGISTAMSVSFVSARRSCCWRVRGQALSEALAERAAPSLAAADWTARRIL